MMKPVTFCLAATALVIGGAAIAQPSTDAVQTVKPKKERKICRTQSRPGSHLSTTVCKTPQQWTAVTGDSRVDTDSEMGFPGDRVATAREMDTRVGKPF
jgi:hypothetical protein